MIRLIGGPLNGIIIYDDSESTMHKFQCIRDEQFGYHVYELNEERMHSFYLETVWVGKLERFYQGKKIDFGE